MVLINTPGLASKDFVRVAYIGSLSKISRVNTSYISARLTVVPLGFLLAWK